MALAAQDTTDLRACGITTPNNPADTGDAQGGLLQVGGKSYTTQTTGWREAMILDLTTRYGAGKWQGALMTRG